MRRFALVAVAISSMVIATPALAASKGGTSSITLVRMTAPLASATSGPALGESVTFSISTTAADPWVNARCYQGGTLVYYESHSFAAGSQPMFQLGPTTLWQSGSADCTGRLLKFSSNGRDQVLASTGFTAVG
ncbi:MAG: hypothetical protein ACJ77A_17660 [Actinomycetota bacterium]